MPPPRPAVHRTIMVVDVERFGDRRRTNPDQVVVRDALYETVQQALAKAGISWAACRHEDRGDGVLVLAPAQIPKAGFVDRVPGVLAAALRQHNRCHPVEEQIRLRMALHAGEVQVDRHGVTSVAVNHTFRLLDARPLKTALAESPGALALIVSGWFFEDVVRHSRTVDPTTFRPVWVVQKETSTVAWIALPDHPYPPDPTALTAPPPQPAADPVPHQMALALRQLPADTALFTGRDDELARLLALAERAGSEGSSGTVVISAIDGMGGIGKTALAIRAAHRLAGRFPDGQLFIDLYGFTQGATPRDPGDALATLLSSLGVPPGQIPTDLDARAVFYRDRLAGARILILLDNAADEAQVHPLLPAANTCLVLITSRRRLKALDDALPLSLDVLAPGEAVALLRKAARLDDRPAEERLLAQVAELCGHLPLALLIAGALLRAGGKAWNLPVLIDRLAARQPGRELAGYTDETRSLKAVFDLSYRNLPEDQQLLFRRLGLLPGPEIDAYAAAALLDTDPDRAGRLMQRLADHNLLTGVSPGRYRIHDLLRAYTRSLTTTLDPVPERDSAVDRLLNYYAHTAQSASIPIARNPKPAPHGPAPAHTPNLPDPEAARTWLRTERPNLQAASAHARAHALHGHAIALAAGLAEILRVDAHWTQALEVQQIAASTAERHSHPAAHATALTDLGQVRSMIGDHIGASDAHTRALEIYRGLGHRHGEANALNNLGRARYLTGDYAGANDAHTRALDIYRALGHRHGEANALNHLGRARLVTGDYPGATDALTRALEIHRKLGNRGNEASALNYYAATLATTGDRLRSLALFQQALAMNRELKRPNDEALSLEGIADHHLDSGDTGQGIKHLRQALQVYQRLGVRADIERLTARLAGLAPQ